MLNSLLFFHFTFLPLAWWLMMKYNDNFKMKKLFIVDSIRLKAFREKNLKHARKSWSRTFFECFLSRFLTLLSSLFNLQRWKCKNCVFKNLFESNFLFLIPILLIGVDFFARINSCYANEVVYEKCWLKVQTIFFPVKGNLKKIILLLTKY